MKKYIILSMLSGVLIGTVAPVSITNAQVGCPIDYNCFPKNVIACAIGWTCIRNIDGFKIETEQGKTLGVIQPIQSAVQPVGMVPQNEIAKLTTAIQSAQHFHALEYYIGTQNKWSQCMDGYCPVGATAEIRGQNLYKYEACRISNLQAQLANLYAGIATSTAQQQDCKNIY